MKIALVQQQASMDRDVNVGRGLKAVRQAASRGARLVAFPELSFVRFFPQFRRHEQPAPWCESIPGPTTDRFSRLAKELGVVVVLNLYEKAGEETYDASPVLDADGSLLGVTRMVHVMEAPGFHEQDYYHPGNHGAPVFSTAVGRVGVAICYDRHYPEYMRALALGGAQLVVIPQAGALGEWPAGIFEAEVQIAAFQNGYFAALVNRVGEEQHLIFAGESFVADPAGQVVARAPAGEDTILYAELKMELLRDCPARRHFLKDRRPELYPRLLS